MIDSITINGVTMGAYSTGYIFEKLKGFDFPLVRVTVQDRGQYDGAKLHSYNYGRRAFVIEGTIYSDSHAGFETKRRALQQALDLVNGLQTLSITTKGGLTLQASVIASGEVEQGYEKGNNVFGAFRLELVAPYPFIEEDSLTTTNLSVFSGGGGAVPSAIPFSLAAGGSGATNITNNGNAYAYPTIKIYGPIENPSVQNTTTDETLSMTYNLTTSTDYIEIDTYNRTVKLNGATNIYQYKSGDWPRLKPGTNKLKLTSASYGGAAQAVITHRDAYLGI